MEEYKQKEIQELNKIKNQRPQTATKNNKQNDNKFRQFSPDKCQQQQQYFLKNRRVSSVRQKKQHQFNNSNEQSEQEMFNNQDSQFFRIFEVEELKYQQQQLQDQKEMIKLEKKYFKDYNENKLKRPLSAHVVSYHSGIQIKQQIKFNIQTNFYSNQYVKSPINRPQTAKNSPKRNQQQRSESPLTSMIREQKQYLQKNQLICPQKQNLNNPKNNMVERPATSIQMQQNQNNDYLQQKKNRRVQSSDVFIKKQKFENQYEKQIALNKNKPIIINETNNLCSFDNENFFPLQQQNEKKNNNEQQQQLKIQKINEDENQNLQNEKLQLNSETQNARYQQLLRKGTKNINKMMKLNQQQIGQLIQMEPEFNDNKDNFNKINQNNNNPKTENEINQIQSGIQQENEKTISPKKQIKSLETQFFESQKLNKSLKYQNNNVEQSINKDAFEQKQKVQSNQMTYDKLIEYNNVPFKVKISPFFEQMLHMKEKKQNQNPRKKQFNKVQGESLKIKQQIEEKQKLQFQEKLEEQHSKKYKIYMEQRQKDYEIQKQKKNQREMFDTTTTPTNHLIKSIEKAKTFIYKVQRKIKEHDVNEIKGFERIKQTFKGLKSDLFLFFVQDYYFSQIMDPQTGEFRKLCQQFTEFFSLFLEGGEGEEEDIVLKTNQNFLNRLRDKYLDFIKEEFSFCDDSLEKQFLKFFQNKIYNQAIIIGEVREEIFQVSDNLVEIGIQVLQKIPSLAHLSAKIKDSQIFLLLTSLLLDGQTEEAIKIAKMYDITVNLLEFALIKYRVYQQLIKQSNNISELQIIKILQKIEVLREMVSNENYAQLKILLLNSCTKNILRLSNQYFGIDQRISLINMSELVSIFLDIVICNKIELRHPFRKMIKKLHLVKQDFAIQCLEVIQENLPSTIERPFWFMKEITYRAHKTAKIQNEIDYDCKEALQKASYYFQFLEANFYEKVFSMYDILSFQNTN